MQNRKKEKNPDRRRKSERKEMGNFFLLNNIVDFNIIILATLP